MCSEPRYGRRGEPDGLEQHVYSFLGEDSSSENDDWLRRYATIATNKTQAMATAAGNNTVVNE
jgi:hypothetical protein